MDDEKRIRSAALGAPRSRIFTRKTATGPIPVWIQTAKLNDVDPQAWLADVLRLIADHPAQRLDELLPWNWRKPTVDVLAEAA